jgi:aryl-alcohol dehydrogenase-like predicted oxidoreductase
MWNPQDETLRAFDDLICAGKVVYIGCSTHPAWMVMEAPAISERQNLARYVSEQPPYNLLDRRVENELIPLCHKYGLAVLPWSPLAGGMLAGRYPPGVEYPSDSRATRSGEYFTVRISRKGREAAARVAEMAKERNMSTAQLARRLRLRTPTVMHHLQTLRLAGLVQLTLGKGKEARTYATRSDAVAAVFSSLQGFFAKGDVGNETRTRNENVNE